MVSLDELKKKAKAYNKKAIIKVAQNKSALKRQLEHKAGMKFKEETTTKKKKTTTHKKGRKKKPGPKKGSHHKKVKEVIKFV